MSRISKIKFATVKKSVYILGIHKPIKLFIFSRQKPRQSLVEDYTITQSSSLDLFLDFILNCEIINKST